MNNREVEMSNELTNEKIDALAEWHRKEYGQLCDREDLRMFARSAVNAAFALDLPPALATLAHIRRSVRDGIVQIHEGSETMADIDAALANLPDEQLGAGCA